MNTCKVYLIKRARTLPSGRKVHYWLLRWSGGDGRQYSESVGRTDRITKRAAKQAQAEKQLAIGSGRVQRDTPRKLTLAQFRDFYKEQRRRGEAPHTRRFLKKYPKLCEETIEKHDMVLR